MACGCHAASRVQEGGSHHRPEQGLLWGQCSLYSGGCSSRHSRYLEGGSDDKNNCVKFVGKREQDCEASLNAQGSQCLKYPDSAPRDPGSSPARSPASNAHADSCGIIWHPFLLLKGLVTLPYFVFSITQLSNNYCLRATLMPHAAH